jgi:hypothetical protein
MPTCLCLVQLPVLSGGYILDSVGVLSCVRPTVLQGSDPPLSGRTRAGGSFTCCMGRLDQFD